ncbi:hypothetical protein ACG9XW_04520 [Acinetobacter guillouiae]|uniref:hypothetical protein n=1 Tax=Acinetobacter guillouiae TaxID=106649 RepID=UPI003AF53EDD
MTNLNLDQETALDILDYLYFYDIVSLMTVTPEKRGSYDQLNNTINNLVSNKKLSLIKSEIYKHFLLCGIEIIVTNNFEFTALVPGDQMYKNMEKRFYSTDHVERYSISFNYICEEVRKFGYVDENFILDIFYILNLTDIREKPHDLCFRLAFQVLWSTTEESISTHVYKKWLDLSIFESNKYSNENDLYNEKNHLICLRAFLLIEFEIMRNKLFHLREKPSSLKESETKNESNIRKLKRKNYLLKQDKFIKNFNSLDLKSIYNIDLKDKKQKSLYLKNLQTMLCHNRIFFNSTNFENLLGAWHLLYFKQNQSKIDNNMSYTNQASVLLKERFGLSLQKEEFCNSYQDIIFFYCFIKQIILTITKEPKCGFIAPNLLENFYYKPELKDGIKVVLEIQHLKLFGNVS